MLTKAEQSAKRELEPKWAQLVYDGLWFSPLRAASTPSSPRRRSSSPARCACKLEPGAAIVTGRRSRARALRARRSPRTAPARPSRTRRRRASSGCSALEARARRGAARSRTGRGGVTALGRAHGRRPLDAARLGRSSRRTTPSSCPTTARRRRLHARRLALPGCSRRRARGGRGGARADRVGRRRRCPRTRTCTRRSSGSSARSGARSTRAGRATTRSRRRSGSTSSDACDEAVAAIERARRRRPRRSAEAEAETPMPGYTHLQRAQPVTVGHHLLAWVEMLDRDRARFRLARARRPTSRRSAPARSPARRCRCRRRPAAVRNSLDARRRPRLRARLPLRVRRALLAPLADRRGARPLGVERVRLRAAARGGRDRLVDDAAEAEPRRRRARARQGGHGDRPADRPARDGEGAAARLRPRPAGGQDAGVRRAPRRARSRSPRSPRSSSGLEFDRERLAAACADPLLTRDRRGGGARRATACRSATRTSRSRRRCARARSRGVEPRPRPAPGPGWRPRGARRGENALRCSTRFLTRPPSRAASSRSAACARPSSPSGSARRSSSTASETLRARARAYREAAPDALVAYSVKAFPNVAVLRLLAEEGLGADVSTTGELEYAIRAGVDPERIVFHGNNKSDDEIARAAAAGVGYLVIDSLDDVERRRAAACWCGSRPASTPTRTTRSRTGHHGSKFGLPPDDAVEAIRRARDAGLDVAGLHLHLGSHLRDSLAARMSVDWLAAFSADLPRAARLGAGGRRPRRRPRHPVRRGRPPAGDRRVRRRAARAGRARVGSCTGCPRRG